MSSSPPTKTEPSNQAKSAMDGGTSCIFPEETSHLLLSWSEHHSEVQAITNDNVGVAARDNLLKKEIVNGESPFLSTSLEAAIMYNELRFSLQHRDMTGQCTNRYRWYFGDW